MDMHDGNVSCTRAVITLHEYSLIDSFLAHTVKSNFQSHSPHCARYVCRSSCPLARVHAPPRPTDRQTDRHQPRETNACTSSLVLDLDDHVDRMAAVVRASEMRAALIHEATSQRSATPAIQCQS